MPETLLTISDLKETLRCSAATARRLLRSGKLRAIRIGRQWRVTAEALRDFLGKNDQVAAA